MKLLAEIKQQTRPFYSLEFFPPKEQENWPEFIRTAGKLSVLKPLFASVTYGAGGGSQSNTLEIARRLQAECGFTPMPHLTCVGADEGRLASYVESLLKIGVDNILALRGDAPKAAHEGGAAFSWSASRFQHASELVSYLHGAFPQLGVAVAAYPAPHPESPSFASDRAQIAQKMNSGADFAVTQLFFDEREYIDLVERLKAAGVDKPVIPGILPIQSFESLRHVLSLCGANIPAKLYIELEEANKRGGAEAVRDAGIKFAVGQIRRLVAAGAPGIHLYTLNKADMCLRIADAVGTL